MGKWSPDSVKVETYCCVCVSTDAVSLSIVINKPLLKT